MVKYVVTGGTILSGKSDNSDLCIPKYNLKDLENITKKYHKNFELLDKEEHISYYIDGQSFNFITEGPKIIKTLEKYSTDHLIIFTGTDSLTWLSKYIYNLTKDSQRRILIVSSMYNCEEELYPQHIPNLCIVANEFISNNSVENGVYILSAANNKADLISIFNIKGTGLAKISCYGSDAIKGSELIYKAEIVANKVDIIRAKHKISSINLDDKELQNFISDSQILLLPMIAGNTPQTIKSYYSRLEKGDIALIEIDNNWLSDINYYNIIAYLN